MNDPLSLWLTTKSGALIRKDRVSSIALSDRTLPKDLFIVVAWVDGRGYTMSEHSALGEAYAAMERLCVDCS